MDTQQVGSSQLNTQTIGRGGTAVAEPTARSGTRTEAVEGHDALTKIFDDLNAMTNGRADPPNWDSTLDQFGTALQKLRHYLWPDHTEGGDSSP